MRNTLNRLVPLTHKPDYLYQDLLSPSNRQFTNHSNEEYKRYKSLVKNNIGYTKEFQKYGNRNILIFVEQNLLNAAEDLALLKKIRSISVGKNVIT